MKKLIQFCFGFCFKENKKQEHNFKTNNIRLDFITKEERLGQSNDF